MPTESQKPKRDIGELALNSKRVFMLAWRGNPGTVSTIVGLTALGAAFPFVRSGALALLINDLVSAVKTGRSGITGHDITYLAVYLVAAIVPTVFAAILRYFSTRLTLRVQEQVEITIMQKQGQLDAARHEDKKFSDLFTRVAENVFRFYSFLQRLVSSWDDVIGVVIAVVVLGFSNWTILAVIILGTIPELISEARFGQRVHGIHNATSEVRRRYSDFRNNFYNLGNIIELKLFQNVPHFLRQVRELYHGFQQEQEDAESYKLRQRFITIFISQLALGFATVWFFMSVLRGSLQVGTLTFLLSTMGQLRGSLSSFFTNLGQQYADSLFMSDIFAYLDTESYIISPEGGIRLDPTVTPEIVFEHVTFSYPDVPKPVLQDFNLRIAPGEKLALIGINGAGKTTIVKLLGRFYDPQEGRILINGHDLRTIDLDSWYHMVGALFQDYSRYRFVVQDAIAIGRTGPGTDLEKVIESAKAAEADEFIREWDKAYEQMLGKNFTEGREPSVGQWQKLALARTFYRDPRVLILDEPTASVDAEAEAKIFERIEQVSSGRTTLLISHRFSTVRQADRIAVIKAGRVSEVGTHEELLAAGSDYARLFKIQAKGYQ